MFRLKCLACFFLLINLVPSTLLANENGKALYAKCIQCHGENGHGKVSEKAPRIAGQHSWYIELSIKAFKEGKRSNPKMLPFIKGLSDKDIKDVANYVSKMSEVVQ